MYSHHTIQIYRYLIDHERAEVGVELVHTRNKRFHKEEENAYILFVFVHFHGKALDCHIGIDNNID